jgi:hypothetical protein
MQKKIVYFYLLSLGLFSRWLVLRGGLIVKSSQCDLLGRRAGIKSTASFSTALDLVYKLQMQSWVAQSPPTMDSTLDMTIRLWVSLFSLP